jgi:hypothetical protein
MNEQIIDTSPVLLSENDIVMMSKSTNEALFCGVYFLIKDLSIVYVGKSSNIHQRIATHVQDKAKEFDRVFILPCPEPECSRLEAHYITRFNPKYNKNNELSKYKFSPSVPAVVFKSPI